MIHALRSRGTLSITALKITPIKHSPQLDSFFTARHFRSKTGIQNLTKSRLDEQIHRSPTTMTTYNINITSDIVCPWCYIGHTRLNKAIANHKSTYPDDKFNLTYRPFYLNPASNISTKGAAFPVESQPRKEYYAAKFGVARAEQIFSIMAQTSRQEGLAFKFGGRTGPSRNGHRLIHFAQTHGSKKKDDGSNNDAAAAAAAEAQNNVILGLWRRYFEQEIDITQLEVLVEVGVEAGLDATPAEIREYLVSGQDAEAVDHLADEARLEGISGVPFYLIQDQWVVEGAQEPAAFEQLFRKWKELEKRQKQKKSATAAAATVATSCDVNGESC